MSLCLQGAVEEVCLRRFGMEEVGATYNVETRVA